MAARPAALSRSGRHRPHPGHRRIGIALRPIFAIRFLSGPAMLRMPCPSFREPERIALSARIDGARVRGGADAAFGRAVSAIPDPAQGG
ncbi:MAG: hypothetical protein QM690_14290 [Sphingobium sp.]